MHVTRVSIGKISKSRGRDIFSIESCWHHQLFQSRCKKRAGFVHVAGEIGCNVVPKLALETSYFRVFQLEYDQE